MPQFKNRPIVVEANQWDGKRETAEMLVHWINTHGGEAIYVCVPSLTDSIEITGEWGEIYATKDWWIVKMTDGDFKTYRPQDFEETYEAA